MTTDLTPNTQTLYDRDYQQWLAQVVAQLRAGHFHDLDLENLIEEIESLGKRDRRALMSYLIRLCEHLLKLMYWETERAYCARGWLSEISTFRTELGLILADSPSLKPYVQDIFPKQYQQGRKLFLNASGLDPQLIPEVPIFSLEQALDDDWLPL